MRKPIEVITSVQGRRRWSRAAGIHTSPLFRWRQELCRPSQSAAESAPPFSAVMIAPAAPAPPEPTAAPIAVSPPPVAGSIVEIEFASGARMRIAGAVDPSMASAMIAALTTPKRRRQR